jgi:hypothetical protein
MSARPQGAAIFIRPASNQLFFIYTGRSRGVGVDPLDFFKQTRLFERNVVIFQDRFRACYQRGISPAIPSFESLLQWQTTLLASLVHVRRVFCLGTSLGGYAALLAGHTLAVERVWAFGPRTVLSDEPDERRTSGSPHRGDLGVALSRDNGTTAFDVYYNEGHAEDAAAANRLAHCPRVTLSPQRGDGHNVVKTLLDRGTLVTLLPAAS